VSDDIVFTKSAFDGFATGPVSQDRKVETTEDDAPVSKSVSPERSARRAPASTERHPHEHRDPERPPRDVILSPVVFREELRLIDQASTPHRRPASEQDRDQTGDREDLQRRGCADQHRTKG
jgi:hypothetical protein